MAPHETSPAPSDPGAAGLSWPPRAVVAIPARDEADHIADCLRALADQQDAGGARLPAGAIGVLLLVNNTTDGTAEVARALAPALPYPLRVFDLRLPPECAHVGWARREALDAAAAWLGEAPHAPPPPPPRGPAPALLGTDADGRARPGWVAALLRALDGGADAAFGTLAVDPDEDALLPADLRASGAAEGGYAERLCQLAALLDPDPHDPWPRHDTHSGANFALTLATYRRLGGLAPVPVSEDRRLAADLARLDARVRHTPDAVVEVSLRLDGRAPGGMADTIRDRLARRPGTPADAKLEPLADALRRLRARAAARALWRDGAPDGPALRALARALRLPAAPLAERLRHPLFGTAWADAEDASPALRQRRPVPLAHLPAALAAADAHLARLARPGRTSHSRHPSPGGPAPRHPPPGT